jgi:hypothetical protein
MAYYCMQKQMYRQKGTQTEKETEKKKIIMKLK